MPLDALSRRLLGECQNLAAAHRWPLRHPASSPCARTTRHCSRFWWTGCATSRACGRPSHSSICASSRKRTRGGRAEPLSGRRCRLSRDRGTRRREGQGADLSSQGRSWAGAGTAVPDHVLPADRARRRCDGCPTLEMDGPQDATGRSSRWANLSLEILSADVNGVVGRNGAGKTTTMRIVPGGLLVDAGKVRWARPPVPFAARRPVCMRPGR